jgi:hypothetical protein
LTNFEKNGVRQVNMLKHNMEFFVDC